MVAKRGTPSVILDEYRSVSVPIFAKLVSKMCNMVLTVGGGGVHVGRTQGYIGYDVMIRPKEVKAPDLHFLNAAKGWLGLGSYQDAQHEVDRINYWVRFHPDVLIVRWKIFTRSKNWESSLDVARSMVKFAPERPSSWICLSYSLCNSDQNHEAWQHLVKAADRFPEVSAIPYFLARLACKVGNLKEATRWLNTWNKMVDQDDLKASAKRDPKLELLWEHLGETIKKESEDAPKDIPASQRQWELSTYTLMGKTDSAPVPTARLK
jgi:hypothetical protein